MKKLLLILLLATAGIYASSQTTCPAPVAHFDFKMSKPVIANQVLGGASVCDPDVVTPSASTATWSVVEVGTPFKIIDIGNGKINIVVSDASAINNSATNTFNLTIKVTDKGISSDLIPLSSTATITISNKNSAPVIINQTL